jgi:[ribosomal protein S5]-alanine N-acetyltransferase
MCFDKSKLMKNESETTLRRTTASDLNTLFVFQLDKEANYLAAFTSKDMGDKDAYIQKYTKFLYDPTINMQTILVKDAIVGSIAKFEIEGKAELTYWIDKSYWGRGIGTKVLTLFLTHEITRPLFARVAFDNVGSQRVLVKCHFEKIGQDRGFAHARQTEIEEYIYKLT